MVFYDKFISLCKEMGVRPSVVATAIGVDKSMPTYWKRGSVPKTETLQKLAQYFDVPISSFFDGSVIDEAEKLIAELPTQIQEDSKEASVWMLEGLLKEQDYVKISDAIEKGDAGMITAFNGITDEFFKKMILEEFKYLNRRGKIEAFMLIQSLSSDDRFARSPQPSPEASEGPWDSEKDRDPKQGEKAPDGAGNGEKKGGEERGGDDK